MCQSPWGSSQYQPNNLSHYHIQSVSHFLNSMSSPTKGNTSNNTCINHIYQSQNIKIAYSNHPRSHSKRNINISIQKTSKHKKHHCTNFRIYAGVFVYDKWVRMPIYTYVCHIFTLIALMHFLYQRTYALVSSWASILTLFMHITPDVILPIC